MRIVPIWDGVFAKEGEAMSDKRCETCRHDLGGGYKNCRINLEAECGASGFEAWEAKDIYKRESGGTDLQQTETQET